MGKHKVKQGQGSPWYCNFAYTHLTPCCQTRFLLQSRLPTAGELSAATCGCTRSCPCLPFRHFAAQIVIICCPGKLIRVHRVSEVGKKMLGEGKCTGICLFTTGKGQHVLCYCVAVVMQGLLPFPGQTPLGLEETRSRATHVTGMQGSIWGAFISKAIWGSISTKLHRKLCFVSGHGEDCLNNNFFKSHHVSTSSQVRGLSRV